ncbi:hypothetical protein POV26_08825 [Aequorivita todarodis]|uniref:hypothetical protein n=1 Tax=Aequorivita todarodis TaxID=2036821 RepID=UPI0023506412|nr:hypothetical protein [Aequorivita todarodis]MDC8001139.1 hypothetical protein [Aequorivita todarodis]
MPALTKQHIEVLGPLIKPFERSSKKPELKRIRPGEGHNEEFLPYIHDGINNHKPEPYYELTIQELEENRIMDGFKLLEKCYLWVIDDVSIKIIWEKTLNVLRGEELPKKMYVCHTNITGCKPAYIGGELHFCENGNIYVNFASDRYGRPETEEKKQMAIQYMKDCGYKNVIMTNYLG